MEFRRFSLFGFEPCEVMREQARCRGLVSPGGELRKQPDQIVVGIDAEELARAQDAAE